MFTATTPTPLDPNTYLSQQTLEHYLQLLDSSSTSQRLVSKTKRLQQHNNSKNKKLLDRPSWTNKVHELGAMLSPRQSPRQPTQRPPKHPIRTHHRHKQRPKQRNQQQINGKKQQLLFLLGKLVQHHTNTSQPCAPVSPRGLENACKELLTETKKNIVNEYVEAGEHHRKHGRHLQALNAFNRAVLFKKQGEFSLSRLHQLQAQLNLDRHDRNVRNNRNGDREQIRTAGGTIYYRDLNDEFGPMCPSSALSASEWEIQSAVSSQSSFTSPPSSATSASPTPPPTQATETTATVLPPSPPRDTGHSTSRQHSGRMPRQRHRKIKTKGTGQKQQQKQQQQQQQKHFWSNPVVPRQQRQHHQHHVLHFGHLSARKPIKTSLRFPIQPPRARFEEEDSLILQRHKEKQRKWERTGFLYSREAAVGWGPMQTAPVCDVLH